MSTLTPAASHPPNIDDHLLLNVLTRAIRNYEDTDPEIFLQLRYEAREKYITLDLPLDHPARASIFQVMIPCESRWSSEMSWASEDAKKLDEFVIQTLTECVALYAECAFDFLGYAIGSDYHKCLRTSEQVTALREAAQSYYDKVSPKFAIESSYGGCLVEMLAFATKFCDECVVIV